MVCLLAFAAIGLGLHAAEAEPGTHLGAITCASGNCHGKIVAEPAANVGMNEHRLWVTQSRHARAYTTLKTPAAKAIANQLGVGAAHTAPACLACHSNNVPNEQRGTRFSVADGVSCEACHGPASGWIRTHSSPSTAHAENLRQGMTALEDVTVRAQICAECHVGGTDKFANHAMMVAGHPRLIFELDAFSTNQPRHHAVDQDYRTRKPSSTGSNSDFGLWLFGQLAAAKAYTALLNTHAGPANSGVWPEFGVYDCHTCHHRMNDESRLFSAGTTPGRARFQDQHFTMLKAAVSVLSPGQSAAFSEAVADLLKSANQTEAQRQQAIAAIDTQLDGLQANWVSRALGNRELRRLRTAVLAEVSAGRVVDYADAAQVYLGLESLSLQIGDLEQVRAQIDRIFALVEEDTGFKARTFRSTVSGTRGQFGG